MEIKIDKFFEIKKNLSKLSLSFLFGGGSLLLLASLGQIFFPNHQPVVWQVTLVIGGFTVLICGLIFLLSLPIYFFKWLFLHKELAKLKVVEEPRKKIKFYLGLGFAVLMVIFFAAINYYHLDAKKCDNLECFTALANKCEATKWQTTDKTGMEWFYYSSPFCRFDKKLLTITGNESEGMKKVLQGQSLSCDYKENKFDILWVSTLIYNLEPCQGDLKESIARLLLLL